MENNLKDNFQKQHKKAKPTVKHLLSYQDLDYQKLQKYQKNYQHSVEQLIHSSEIFWREAFGLNKFAQVNFPYKETYINATYNPQNNTLFISWETLKTKVENIQVGEEFLPWDIFDSEKRTSCQIIAVKIQNDPSYKKEKLKTKRADIKTPIDLTDKLGFTADPRIADLVVTFNRLGMFTSQSCEGHTDWGLPYPWIDFPNAYLKSLITALIKLPEVLINKCKIEKLGLENFRLIIQDQSLSEAQTTTRELAQKLGELSQEL